ncbi:MAG: hypothetical protein A3K19_31155 [Lentisphaerae bacterium RIFOXYB12_FULL_65_16]|nr:MAG: hypothetical protein A3K18_26920 [Lentisphaerae bacterium RIFOXYA12_64_32]OGV88897.1 MAG: hypothetical protein A3K19_31155 [Lentisphaerae bacterium RIFOXYB12_FULL_65_16]
MGLSRSGGTPRSQSSGWGRYFLSLLVVGGVMVGVLMVLRRLRGQLVGAPQQHNLRLLGRLPLDQRNSLTLISVKDEELLVGHGPEGVRLLRRYPNGARASGPDTTAKG